MKYLNLGCGSKFHPNWINVDMYANDESVLACNFSNGIPFENNYFDIVYHSHVLEHFTQPMGKKFIQECFRILKRGGVLRMAFPDLEKIVNEYKHNLYRLDMNDNDAEPDYDWIMLEMYDQTVRNKSGGEMIKYLNDKSLKNKEYVSFRIGNDNASQKVSINIESSINDEIQKLKKSIQASNYKNSVVKILEKLKSAKDKLCFSLLSKIEKENFKIGQFRTNGEIHQWMYDRYSINRLLKQLDFGDIKIRTAAESYIKDWSGFNLDNPNEHASLFVEAIKPHN